MSNAIENDVLDSKGGITFHSFDKLGRKDFAARLTQVITKFHPFYDDAFVLSLNAKFGSGKTTFLEMWKHQLEEQNFKVISINAWETDFDDEPLIPIISAIMDEIGSQTGAEKVRSALGKALGAAAMTTNQIVKHTTGIDVDETATRVEIEGADLEKLGTDLYQSYSFKNEAYHTLKKRLAEYVEKLEVKPLIVFVDELDRVRPDYSVKFLEAIKHIFSVQGICFVLAVDRGQLEASVSQLYGKIDFESYYMRFITREANLPDVMSSIELRPYIDYLSVEFFDKKNEAGVHFPFEQAQKREILSFISKLCSSYELVPREIEAFFRIFSQFMAVADNDCLSKKTWVDATALLIATSIHSSSLYHKIGRGLATPTEVELFIKGLNYSDERHNDKRYFLILAMAFMLRNDDVGSDAKQIALICLKFDGNDPSGREGAEQVIKGKLDWLSNIVDSIRYYRGRSGFQVLYSNIEEWRSFIE